MPYAVFGHSMGSMISYELAQRIRKNNLLPAVHFFFSGRRAPQVINNEKKRFHLMTEEEFRREVIQLGGTPPEFFDCPEILDLYLPVLKNDFRIAETEIHCERNGSLQSDITVFFGRDEVLTVEEREGWKIHTKGQCNIHYFEGGHFFLQRETDRLVGIINRTLLKNGVEGPPHTSEKQQVTTRDVGPEVES